jgi:serine/threonine protein kinase
MVFPYMDHDLAGLLENQNAKLTEAQIKLYARQLLEGTHYLHAVRRDALPEKSIGNEGTERRPASRSQGRQLAHQ